MRAASIQTLVLATAASVWCIGSASASTIYWTDFTNATYGQTTGTATGTITTPTATIGVSYQGEVASPTIINNTYPSWGPSSTYADGTIVADAPTYDDLIAQTGGAGTGTNTITFSVPVTNLVMAIWSLGNGGDNANYTFSQPFTIVAGGPSNEYGGSALTRYGVNGVSGSEGNGTIVFNGTFSTFSFINTNYEYYYGFELGVAGAAPVTTTVPEPASLAVLGMGVAGIAAVRRRRLG